ncbi:hypothetical protein CHU98_g11904 [Xylaria longipes]|nr:hypothetical protein CHU98_g11904 [Xylaria longipes]
MDINTAEEEDLNQLGSCLRSPFNPFSLSDADLAEFSCLWDTNDTAHPTEGEPPPQSTVRRDSHGPGLFDACNVAESIDFQSHGNGLVDHQCHTSGLANSSIRAQSGRLLEYSPTPYLSTEQQVAAPGNSQTQQLLVHLRRAVDTISFEEPGYSLESLFQNGQFFGHEASLSRHEPKLNLVISLHSHLGILEFAARPRDNVERARDKIDLHAMYRSCLDSEDSCLKNRPAIRQLAARFVSHDLQPRLQRSTKQPGLRPGSVPTGFELFSTGIPTKFSSILSQHWG